MRGVSSNLDVPVLISLLASRQVVYQTWGGQEHLSSLDKVKASSIAGGFSGMMGGLLREYTLV